MTTSVLTQGLRYVGAWSSSTAYVVGNVVSQSGSAYVCVAAHTNHVPPNTSFWDASIIQGTQGAQGPQGLGGGSQGSQGVQGAQGAQGAAGTNGANGNQGSQGNQGAQGPQGFQGFQGFQGTSGTSGTPLNGTVTSGAVIWDGVNWVNQLVGDSSISDVTQAKVTGLAASLAGKVAAGDGAWSRSQQEKYRGLVVSESIPWWAPRDTQSPVSGTAYFVLMPVEASQVISAVVLATIGAATFGSNNDGHWWTAIYDVGLTTRRAFSGDQGFTAIAGAALVGPALSYTVPSDGSVRAVYGCFMINIGTGGVPAMPTFRGVNAGLAALNGANTLGSGTVALGTGGTGLGATTPATPVTLTAISNSYYMGFK